MSVEKVELGRHLFYDPRLSHNETQACASCHLQSAAFSEPAAQSRGSTGELTPRSSMSLANVAYASTLTWANPLLLDLESQALVPMFGDTPIELGLRSENELVERLSEVERYQVLFGRAFPETAEPITLEHTLQALASFERTLISGRSDFDRYLYDGVGDAISESAKRGHALFNSEELECFHCHLGFSLTDHVHWRDKAFFTRPYHNTGLYNLDETGAYPAPNTGTHSVTGEPRDMGRFKAPTLRNIAVTAPYMHDGSIQTLDEVLDHYQAGGRTIESGPYAGDGSLNPNRSTLIRAFELSEAERKDVLAFLDSLTDHAFLTDKRFANPWLASDIPRASDAGTDADVDAAPSDAKP
jgi:cytochrome c peroxidase